LNIRLLDQLRAASGDYVPLSELGPGLDQVHKDLTALISFGFGIEQHPYRGASYVGPAERLCPDQIEHELATRRLGRRIVVWKSVTSTNDLAARAGASHSNDGLVILAEEQTSGRGRRGRSWMAPPRSSILMSVVLFPPSRLMPGDSAGAFGRAWLTALGAVAAADVISSWTGRHARIKWPNDVRLDGRKIAGVLVERALAPRHATKREELAPKVEPDWGVLIGIGLNANLSRENFPPELAAVATSLQIEREGAPVDRSELARDLIRRLDYWYDLVLHGGPETLNAAWCQRSEHLGQEVTVATPSARIVGRLVDLDVRFGVTLQFDRAPGVFKQPAIGPCLDLAKRALPLDQSSDASVLDSAELALECRLTPLARLPLADIRSIEPSGGGDSPSRAIPDS